MARTFDGGSAPASTGFSFDPVLAQQLAGRRTGGDVSQIGFDPSTGAYTYTGGVQSFGPLGSLFRGVGAGLSHLPLVGGTVAAAQRASDEGRWLDMLANAGLAGVDIGTLAIPGAQAARGVQAARLARAARPAEQLLARAMATPGQRALLESLELQGRRGGLRSALGRLGGEELGAFGSPSARAAREGLGYVGRGAAQRGGQAALRADVEANLAAQLAGAPPGVLAERYAGQVSGRGAQAIAERLGRAVPPAAAAAAPGASAAAGGAGGRGGGIGGVLGALGGAAGGVGRGLGAAAGRSRFLRFIGRHPLLSALGASVAIPAFLDRKGGAPPELADWTEFGFSPDEAARAQAMVTQLGMAPAEVYAQLQPALEARQAQEAQAEQMLSYQSMMAPYIASYQQQAQQALAQQADVLRGLLPRLPGSIRPLGQAYIESQLANQQALLNQSAIQAQQTLPLYLAQLQGGGLGAGGGGAGSSALEALIPALRGAA